MKPSEGSLKEETSESPDFEQHEVEDLSSAIKKVELARANQPKLYSKALSEMKGHAKVISSIKELKSIAKKKAGDVVEMENA